MVSWPCDINDRDVDTPVFPHKTNHFSRVIKEVMMAFYSDIEEVKNVEDMIKNDCKVMVLLRGLPGSGKSTLARYLLETLPDTSTTKEEHIFSADDYFIDPKNNSYVFNRKFLREAHSWNVEAVLSAAQTNVSPIIVDNTNLTVSEMWPYACIAAKYDYVIMYLEPNTHWRYNIHECAKRNLHGVSEKHIARMLGRFDRSVSECELLSLVSPQTNFQNNCDTHSTCRIAITRHCRQRHYEDNRYRELRSICVCNEKIFKPFCKHAESCSPNLPTVLLDPTDILRTTRTSVRPVAQQLVLTSLLSTSALIKSLFSEGILSIPTICNIRRQDRTCKTVSLRNNVLAFYDQIFKCMSFLHLFVSVRNAAICAAQFMSMKEMCDQRMSLEKNSLLTTYDRLGRYCSIAIGDKPRMILEVEPSLQPSVNINNVKIVVFPSNVRSLCLPAPKNICGRKVSFEADNRNNKNKVSRIFYTETAARFPSLAKICTVERRSTCQANSWDLEDAKSIRCSRDVWDSSKSDSWNVSDNGNYEPWDVSDNGGSNSWDMCGNASWETDTHRLTSNESDCVLPKPPRTDTRARIARHSREQNPVKMERKSSPTVTTTEEEMNCSLPKPRRTNIRPRTIQYSWEEYVSKLEPKMISPELEAWNAVEDPLSSWERKQNIESGNEATVRELHKSQIISPAVEEEHLTSKPQREKRIRNRQ